MSITTGQINNITTAVMNVGSLNYINNKIDRNIDTTFKQILQKLIDLNINDSNNGNFSDFYNLSYNINLSPTPDENIIYNRNASTCFNRLVPNLTNEISMIYPNVHGRIIIATMSSIIFDSNKSVQSNTLTNARNNTINTYQIQTSSSYMTSNRSQNKLGIEVYHTSDSFIKTIYVAFTLGPQGYNDMTVFYCVSWDTNPYFLS